MDDDTVVFVADPGLGNILNFSVGANVDLEVPPSFWTRLAGKYGSKFYWQENGEEASISNAVSAIDTCFREDPEAQVREGSGGAGRAALEREVWQGVVRTCRSTANETPSRMSHL